MKNILVEFNDYGAIIHKHPSVIEKKQNNPNCFLNPDLSRVYGVSPAFWSLNEYNKIIPCSEEEMQRRTAYHKTIVTSTASSVEKVNIEDLREEFDEKFSNSEDALNQEINRLKQEISQSDSKNEQMIKEFVQDLIRHKEMLNVISSKVADEAYNNKKNHNKLAIGIGLAAILAVALKVFISLN